VVVEQELVEMEETVVLADQAQTYEDRAEAVDISEEAAAVA
jgi:hypothetical protein